MPEQIHLSPETTCARTHAPCLEYSEVSFSVIFEPKPTPANVLIITYHSEESCLKWLMGSSARVQQRQLLLICS